MATGLWEPEKKHMGDITEQKNDKSNARRWCGAGDPGLWSRANPAGLESDPTTNLSLIHAVCN